MIYSNLLDNVSSAIEQANEDKTDQVNLDANCTTNIDLDVEGDESIKPFGLFFYTNKRKIFITSFAIEYSRFTEEVKKDYVVRLVSELNEILIANSSVDSFHTCLLKLISIIYNESSTSGLISYFY